MKRHLLLMLLLMTSALIGLAGCTITGDDIYPALDDTAPEVLRTFPEQGWIQVPRSVTIKVWFSEPVDPSKVSVATMTLSSGEHFQRCRYRVGETEDGLGLVEMSPMDELMGGVEYQLAIYQGLKDLSGNELLSVVEVSFRTMER